MSGCSNPRERLVVQHPPVNDLTVLRWAADVAPGICTSEPPVPSEEALDADPNAGLVWDAEVRARGGACRDALERVCEWHVDRGLELPAGLACRPEAR